MSEHNINKPKYRQIFEFVHMEIDSGQYEAGAKLPSDGQLMRRFATSRPTVARAMRELQQAGFIDRRPGSGSFVLSAAHTKNRLLGLLIPGLGETEIFEPICAAIARGCGRHNFSLLWGDSPSNGKDSAEKAKSLCRQYIDQKVAGVFFAPLELTPGMHEVNRQIVGELDRASIAVVLLDRDIEKFPNRSKFDYIGIDNFRAGYQQANHLLKLGCCRIDYLSRNLSAPTVDMRIAGYRLALKDHGIEPDDNWTHHGDPADREFVRPIVDMAPDAIITANDITAANLMQTLAQLKVRVPEEIRVVGLDDIKYAQLLSVPLTTVAQPCDKMGTIAVATMLQRLEDRSTPPRTVLLDTEMVVRKSCGTELLPSTT